MKKIQQPTALRVALYIRVSSQEQAIKGLSLEAQQEDLEEYARKHGWIITGVYVDAAKTARKRLGKRESFLRMLDSVKRDEVDIILFTRLDRWFRSVADYYKVMEILESHNCGWLTTQEEYDTTTAGGRLYINIRLSIAQNEADLCGERIGAVFDSKVKHGTVVSGKCPFGYRVNDEKRLEIVPEKAAIVQDAFEHYRTTISQYATIKYIRETYGVNWCTATFQRMLHEKMYTGRYERRGREKDDFCPAIISQELFDAVQALTANNVKATPAGRKYLFSSLLICAECGHRLSSFYNTHTVYYRCNHYSARALCTHSKLIREDVIEKWLFDNLGQELEKYRLEWEVKETQRRRSESGTDRAAIRRKLARLKELYVNEIIDIEDYRRDYERYTAQLAEQPGPLVEARPNFEAVEALLAQGFREIYDGLGREEQRTLWHSAVKEIHINNSNEIVRIVFL